MAGFPCKELPRNRIDNLPSKGLRHKESKFFSEIPRISSTLRRIARARNMEVHYIVENVKMPPEEHDIVCNVLNGIPTMIQASRVCAASRPRLFWTSFEISPLEGESLEKGEKTNVLHLKQVPIATLAQFWDPEWGPHKNSQMPFPCVTGWQQKPRPPDPTNTAGHNKSSEDAKIRWKEDGWATSLTWYEDTHMAHETNGTRIRVISPTECERLLGFEPNWTHPGGKPTSALGYQRKNAIGNASAVPVIACLLLALTMTVHGEGTSAFPHVGKQRAGCTLPP